MGRRRISESDRRFRAEVAQRLRRAMRERGLNQAEAARELGVTRQAVSQYLGEKTTPQAEILAKACANWGITIPYRDAEFKTGAFASKKTATDPEVLQLDLFKEPQIFQTPRLVVTLARSHRAALQVTIAMKPLKHAGRTSSSRRLRKTS